MSFVGYVIKVVCQPNQQFPNDPDSVFQVILLTADGEILCMQVHDPNFFIKPSFPNEQSRVICDGIVLTNLMQVVDQEHKIVKEEKYYRYLETLEYSD